MKTKLDWTCRALATCFFTTYPLERWAFHAGRQQTGAGLVGSLAGLACVTLLPTTTLACVLSLLGVVFISVVISEIAEKSLGRKDDQRIVIDEWAGYLISMAMIPVTAWSIIASLILFRLLDSLKPFGIKRFAQLPGGWGIVMDDVAAGLVANVVLRILPLP
jgi:phosphatidylglycerophosphatase A